MYACVYPGQAGRGVLPRLPTRGKGQESGFKDVVTIYTHSYTNRLGPFRLEAILFFSPIVIVCEIVA